MSNIGKQPIIVPDGTEISINNNSIVVKGKLGELNLNFKSEIQVNYDNNIITVLRKNDLKESRELHGLYRALIQNMIDGVTSGFSKELELNGVGYTAEKKGDFLLVNAGYSHPVYLYIPNGINIEVPSTTSIVVKGINKQNVGDIASKIRSIRKPEPYKGKGIKYIDEVIRRKAGKKVGSGAA